MSRGAPDVCVIIPTRGRPDSLGRAIRSVSAQKGVAPEAMELLVVDNDPARSAEATVDAFAGAAPFVIRYVCEPTPGVASARNAGLACSSAPLIAFLDDDEEAPSGWLSALLEAREHFDADAVFGPVRTRLPETVRRHRSYLEEFFSRQGPPGRQLLDHYFGCGDSLIRRAALPHPTAPFDLARNLIGGEDDLLFQGMKAAGARFAWAPDAWVWEHPDPERLTLAYTLKRAFAYGQGPSFACMARTPPDRMGAAYWMAVGAGQALVFGLASALKWIAFAPDRARMLDRAARGLGKVLWFPPFKPKFYGRPADLARG